MYSCLLLLTFCIPPFSNKATGHRQTHEDSIGRVRQGAATSAFIASEGKKDEPFRLKDEWYSFMRMVLSFLGTGPRDSLLGLANSP